MIARRGALLAAIAATAALAAGCGDGLSGDEYADAVRPFLINFGDESERLADELGGADSNEEAVPFLEDLQTLTEATIADLEGIEPPADAVAGHDALVDALDGYLSSVGDLLGVLESGTDAEAQVAGQAFVEQAQETLAALEDARRQLEDAGVPVGEEITTDDPSG